MPRTRMVKVLGPMVVVASLALGACGSSGGGSAADEGERGQPLTATVPDGSSTSSSTSTSTASTAEPSGTVPGPFVDGAIAFVDPQGSYTIDISPAWTERSGTMAAEIEAWLIGIDGSSFADNVNVLTQNTEGRDLQEYLDFSAANLGGLELLANQTVTGAAGNQLGLIEYSGTLAGAPVPLHALATVAVSGGTAVVATLTGTEDTFAQSRVEAEPYLRTLQHTAD